MGCRLGRWPVHRAGISQQLVTGIINRAPGDAGLPVGIIPKWIDIIRLQLIGFGYHLHLRRDEVHPRHRRNSGAHIYHNDHSDGSFCGVHQDRDTSGPQPRAGCARTFPVKLVYASFFP